MKPIPANRGKDLVSLERQAEIIPALRAGERHDEIAKRLGITPGAVTQQKWRAVEKYRKPLAEECDAYVEVELLALAPRRDANRERHERLHEQFMRLSAELKAIQEFDEENRAFRNTDTSKLEQRLQFLSDSLIKLDDQNLRHSNRLAFLIGFDAVKQQRGNTTEMLVAFNKFAENSIKEMPTKLEELGLPVQAFMQLYVKELHDLLTSISEAATG